MEFVSLGPNCHTAGLFKKLKYKKCSYPFDWILTNIKIVNHCINNNFIDFIDRNNYIISKNKHYSNFLTFKNENFNYLDPMFIHKNPLENESDYLYTLRCIERFNNLQFINNHILFVHTVYNEIDLNDINIIELQNTLNIKYGNKKYHLLFIEYLNINNDNDNYLPNTYSFKIDNNIILLKVYIKYDPSIEFNVDYSILNFLEIFNPIEEIIKEII